MKEIRVAIDARKAQEGGEQVEGAFEEMVRSAIGASTSMGRAGDRIDRNLKDTGRQADKTANKMSNFKRAFVFTAAIAGTVALAASVQALVTNIDEIGKAAGKSNVTTEFFQVLEFAASQTGVAMANVEGVLKDLNIRLGQASQGSKPMIDAFRDIGVEINDANGELKSLEEIFPEVVDGLASLGSDAERSSLGIKLMGEQYTQANNLLKDGSKTFVALGKDAKELGIIMSEDTFKAAANLNDQFDILTRSIGAEFAGALTILTPILLSVVSGIRKFVVGVGDIVEGLGVFFGLLETKSFSGFVDQSDNANASIEELTRNISDLRDQLRFLKADQLVVSDDESVKAIAAAQQTLNGLQKELNIKLLLKKIEQDIIDAREDALKAEIAFGTEPNVVDEKPVGPNLSATREILLKEIELIAESVKSQEEIRQDSLDRQQIALQEAVDNRIISADRAEKLLTKITNEGSIKRTRINLQTTSTAIGGFASLVDALLESDGKMTNIAKGFALTQIAINTAVAIMKGYAQLGPIGGTIAAVGLAAAGAAQAINVLNADSGAQSSATSIVAPEFESAASITREDQGSTVVQVTVVSSDPTTFVRDTLAPVLSDIINEDDTILFDENSRQAQLLGAN